jgi:hypothetical protein
VGVVVGEEEAQEQEEDEGGVAAMGHGLKLG